MLYNNPFTTGVNLGPDTIAAFGRDVENIEYVKDSSKDWEQALRLIHHHREAHRSDHGLGQLHLQCPLGGSHRCHGWCRERRPRRDRRRRHSPADRRRG